MSKLDAIIGDEVAVTYSGKWRRSRGPELPGICATKWVYAPLLVSLKTGRVLQLQPSETLILPRLPLIKHVERLATDSDELASGRRIVDVLSPADGEPEVSALLSGALLLRHYYLPGGSHYTLEAVKQLALVDEENTQWSSLISGHILSYEHLLQHS